jgi:hydrogenase-4 component F
MLIELLLGIPLLTALLCFPLKKHARWVEAISLIGAGSLLLLTLWISLQVWSDGPIWYGYWYVDELSVLMLGLIALISLMATAYSINYIRHDQEDHDISLSQLRTYYILMQVFVSTMLLVVVSNNLGIMWIAIEGTTLVSTFLVGFYEKDTSIEAAWKYIIICSVGIALALFGTVLTYASTLSVPGISADGLNWTTLRDVATLLDPTFLKIAFIFIVIGYGTKVGLVPMHTWLPDAHSQAPTPISALLSAVLLNCAFYGILRYLVVMQLCVPGFAPGLLMIFALLSLAVAAAFILVAKDFKRLLAYSSIEHMGIIALGFGIGGFLGIFGALFHMLNHALTKCLLFFSAGNILQKYNTRSIEEVRGLATIMPVTGVIFLLGALAITGSPPFSIFMSELLIMQAGLNAGQYLVVGLYLLFLLFIFGGFMYHVSRMMFGKPTEGVVRGEMHKSSFVPMAILLALIIVIGVLLPQSLIDLLTRTAAIFPGGTP